MNNKNHVYTKNLYCSVCNTLVPVISEKRTKGKQKIYCPVCGKKQNMIDRKASLSSLISKK